MSTSFAAKTSSPPMRILQLTFRSTSIEFAEDGTATVAGELAIRGLSGRVNATGTFFPPTKDPFGGERVGLEVAATIDRRTSGHELADAAAQRRRGARLGGRRHRPSRTDEGPADGGCSGSAAACGEPLTEQRPPAGQQQRRKAPVGVKFRIWHGLHAIPAYNDDIEGSPRCR